MYNKPEMTVHAYNPSTRGLRQRDSKFDLLGPHIKIMSQTTITTIIIKKNPKKQQNQSQLKYYEKVCTFNKHSRGL